ncbi:MAG: glutathione peroxidase [Gammaproteobacteria bacterium]
MKSIYDFSVKDSSLKDVSLSEYKDKVLLIVNVASYCGLTYQYEGLEKLYKKYKNKDFEILGFPCNQFALQEPGSNEEIKKFCDTKYGITFKILNKINVNGSKEDPFYTFLKNKRSGVGGTKQIKWNFTKFLINKDGDVVNRFGPQSEPKDIESSIKELI